MGAVAAVFGSGLALVFIVIFAREFLRLAAARHWPQVPGTVRRVVIEQHMKTGGADEFSARVDYEFSFEGRPQRDCESLGASCLDRDEAVRQGSAYTAGQQIYVAVDPANPRNSTLRPGLQYGYLVGVVFGIALLVFFLSRLMP
jgi:hypothetical protein